MLYFAVQCKSLEVRLFGLDSSQTKMEMDKQLEQLEADCQDKDLYIATLQCQLEEQVSPNTMKRIE